MAVLVVVTLSRFLIGTESIWITLPAPIYPFSGLCDGADDSMSDQQLLLSQPISCMTIRLCCLSPAEKGRLREAVWLSRLHTETEKSQNGFQTERQTPTATLLLLTEILLLLFLYLKGLAFQ